jgi:hypothetical protein
MTPGCDRSENYHGQKRPFSRKDKLNSHVRKIHQAATGPYGSSSFLAANTPNVVDASDLTGFEGYANDSCPMAVTGFSSESNWLPGGPDSTGLTSVDELTSVDGLTNVNGFTSIDGLTNVNGFTSVDGLTSVEGLTSIDGLTSVNGFTIVDGLPNVNGFISIDGLTNVNGFTSVDGLTSIDRLTSVDGFTRIDGLTNVDRLTNVDGLTSIDGLTSVAGTDVYGYTATGTFSTDDEFGWLAGDFMFSQ